MTAATLEALFAVQGDLPEAPLIPAQTTWVARLNDSIGKAIEARQGELHTCVFCGDRAWHAFYQPASDLLGTPKWIDACGRHGLAVLRLITAEGYPDDAEIIRRYAAWAARR